MTTPPDDEPALETTGPAAGAATDPGHDAGDDGEYIDTDYTRSGPRALRVEVARAGPHVLEILTPEQWAALSADDYPDDFTCHNGSWYIRFSPAP